MRDLKRVAESRERAMIGVKHLLHTGKLPTAARAETDGVGSDRCAHRLLWIGSARASVVCSRPDDVRAETTWQREHEESRCR
jgi:hypothetical protein